MTEQKSPHILFLLGYGRSGTTLLNSILTQHPDIHFINVEFNELSWFYQSQHRYEKYGEKKYYFLTRDFFRSYDFSYHVNVDDLPIDWSTIKSFRSWVDCIFDYFRQKSGKLIIGVKIAGTLAHVIKKIVANTEMINAEFSDAYRVHLVRDPRDVILSVKKMKPFSSFLSPFYFGRYWCATVTHIHSLADTGHYHRVRYEDLITQPTMVIKEICSFLRIPFNEQMMKFYQKVRYVDPVLHPNLKSNFLANNFGKWKTGLSTRDQQLLLAAAQAVMGAHGYLDGIEARPLTAWQWWREYSRMTIFRFFNSYYFNFLKQHARRVVTLPIVAFGRFLKYYSPSVYWFLKWQSEKKS